MFKIDYCFSNLDKSDWHKRGINVNGSAVEVNIKTNVQNSEHVTSVSVPLFRLEPETAHNSVHRGAVSGV